MHSTDEQKVTLSEPGSPASVPVAAVLALLIIIPVLIYARSWKNTMLQWDDPLHTVANPHFNPLSWHGIGELWREPFFGLYVPVAYTVLAGETWLAQRLGTDEEPHAGVYHVGSLAIHIANVWLVFAILRRLVNDDLSAAAGAMLFAVHPLQVESVAWLSETRGLLAALFGLTAILFYLKWIDARAQARSSSQGPAESSGLSWVWYGSAVAAFVLAMLSKPSAAAIPLVLAIIDVAIVRRGMWPALLSIGPWLAIVVTVALITRKEQSTEEMQFVTPLFDRPRVAGDAIAFYLYKLAWPWNLATEYDRSARQVVAAQWSWFTAAVPVLLGITLVFLRQWTALIGLAIFVAAIFPVSGIAPFAYQDYSTVADRYAYLALLGPALLLAWWLRNSTAAWPLFLAAAALGVLAVMSFIQVGYWRDDRVFFGHVLDVSPQSYMAHEKFGVGFLTHGNAEEALKYLLEAERLNPQFVVAPNNAGIALSQLGRWAEAAEQFQIAARLAPKSSLIQCNLANAFIQLNKLREAEDAITKAIRIDPNAARVRLVYGELLAEQGNPAAALRELDAGLKLEKNDAAALATKGKVLCKLGKLAEAEQCLTQALGMNALDTSVRDELRRVRERRRQTASAEHPVPQVPRGHSSVDSGSSPLPSGIKKPGS